jgi:Ca2+-binding RTX toxin-like protein
MQLRLVIAVVLVLSLAPNASAHFDEQSFASTCAGHTYDGHQHSDRIIGSSICDRADLFRGLFGDDELWGNGGADELWGSMGSDEVRGGPGNDLIYGNEGPDDLFGSTDNDRIYGGDGNDTIDCGLGSADQAWGGPGTDTFVNCDGNAHQ